MSWVKIDDGAPEHRKLLEVGASAAWLWVCGLAYCNRQKACDGFIPEAKVPTLYPMVRWRTNVERLLKAGLWERETTGFRIHDYHEFQPTPEEANERRRKRSEAGKKGGLASAATRTIQANGQANAKQSASSKPSKRQANVEANVEPRPDPVPSEEKTPLSPPTGGASPSAGPESETKTGWRPLTARPWYAEEPK